ncbi:MAG: hypothetical protein K0R24_2076, partial [Gammaproteobacteria bacterium]|nr:hypothetical protein [Gammaproteobacteria bacterium]
MAARKASSKSGKKSVKKVQI